MKHPFLIILMLLSIPSCLFAQADTTAAEMVDDSVPGTWMVVASGGWTFPTAPVEFKEHFKTDYNFGGGIAYSMSPGSSGYGEVSLLLHYYNVLFTHSGFRTANSIPAATEVYTAMLQFRGVYSTSEGNIAPFFTMGIGLYHVALPERGLTTPPTVLFDEQKETTFGWSVGLGVDVPVTDRATLFIDGKFLLGVSGSSGYRLFSGGGGVRFQI
jgi:opacity protein-like surface antigen